MTRASWMALAGVIVLATSVYLNSLGGQFTYDENIVILRNDNVLDPGRMGSLWLDTYWGSAVSAEVDSLGWRPLTIFTFHLDHRAAGADPGRFHAVNVALHAMCSALFLVAMLLLGFPLLAAVVAASLFAVHAIHTEAVAQIVGRAELLAAAGALAGLICHLKAFPVSGARGGIASPAARWAWTAAAASTFFLGLLGKESALGFIAMVVAADLGSCLGSGWLAAFRDVAKHRWRPYLAYMVPVAAFLVAREVLFGRAFPAGSVHFVDNPIVTVAPALRPLAAMLPFGKALLLLLVPASLSADYGYAQLPVDRFWTSGNFWLGLAALALAAWACLRPLSRRPFLLWGVVAFLGSYLPLSNAFFPIQTILGERLLYVPSIGVCALAGAAFARAAGSSSRSVRTAAWSVLAVVMLFNVVRTPLRNRDWHDDLHLFDATSKVSTRSVRVLNNYGNVLYTRGDIEGAEEEYRKALSLFPDYDDAKVNLAGVVMQKGDYREARELLDDVLAGNPEHSVARANADILARIESSPAPPPGAAHQGQGQALELEPLPDLEEADESRSSPLSDLPRMP